LIFGDDRFFVSPYMIPLLPRP